MTTGAPLVLIHGGGFDHRCWEPLLPHLTAPAIAVDLPGRGQHPAPLASVTFSACAEAVAGDIEAAGYDEVVLVGHSLAGCSMPAVVGALGDRVRHVVFVACTVPAHGTGCLDTLDPEVRAMADAAPVGEHVAPMGEAMARMVLGEDLDDAQFAWCLERMVPEAPRLTTDPVDLTPLRSAVPRTWVRTMGDLIVAPDKQLRFAANAGDCRVVDLDAGHMCMVSRPEALAAILDSIASPG